MKKRNEPHITPELKTDKFIEVRLACLICGELTGETESTRESLQTSEEYVRKGLCDRCQQHANEGCALVFTEVTPDKPARGAIMEPGWLETLKPELREDFRGQARRISDEDMDRIMGISKETDGNG